MPRAQSNGIEIEYEEHGPADGVPLLLICGLGGQLSYWPPEFIDGLTARGLRVIVFDNRDTGFSTWFEDAGVPDRRAIAAQAAAGQPTESRYRLADMAADGVGLLDHLGIETAHIAGFSMGGMISQTIVIEHPERARSLISLMSMAEFTLPAPAFEEFLFGTPPPDPDAAVAWLVRLLAAANGTKLPFDAEAARADVMRQITRRPNPAAAPRHFAAVVASGSRVKALADVRVPTLVVHGGEDPAIPLPGGELTAASIPGSRLVVIDELGHSFPPSLRDRLAGLVADHALAVEAGSPLPV